MKRKKIVFYIKIIWLIIILMFLLCCLFFKIKNHIILFFIFLGIFLITEFLIKKLINLLFSIIYKKIISKTKKFIWANSFYKYNFFSKFSTIISASLILFITKNLEIKIFYEKIIYIYLILSSFFIINTFINASLDIYNHYKISKILPLKWLLELIKILIFFFLIMLIVSILYKNFSFWKFFSSLGALTALILLLFKDSLLGVVSSIVLVKNNMIKIGDWIEIEKFNANGLVLDITLTNVKVQNWDKSYVFIPIYSLISDSFKNWDGMLKSGTRRLIRKFDIDFNSIKLVNDAFLEKIKNDSIIKNLINLENFNLEINKNTTNIIIFRKILMQYLKSNSFVDTNNDIVVRYSEQKYNIVSLEIFLFLNETSWSKFENIQTEILDVCFYLINIFDLKFVSFNNVHNYSTNIN